MKLAIINYNAGNTQSVIYALERLGIQPLLTDDPEELKSADRILLPGVGEASSAMNSLKSRGLDKVIGELKQPFLGICVGMQLMCSHSEENNTPCLNIFSEKVLAFNNYRKPEFKIPHMGWNQLEQLKSPLFKGVLEGTYAYFAHSYYVEDSPFAIVHTDYIQKFASGLQKDNFYAVQFHPEKSGELGVQLFKNFLEIN